MNSQRVGIIGCGSIGDILSRYIEKGRAGDTELSALLDSDTESAFDLASDLDSNPDVYSNFPDMLDDESIDILIEAASQKAVWEYLLDSLRSGKDFVVLSVGAFADAEFREKVRKVARDSGCYVYIPSGAILGLDGIQAASMAEVDRAILTTRKPATTLARSKYVRERGIDLSDLNGSKMIFEGTADQAVEAFPGSVNVAAALSIAGIGFEETQVRIVADQSLEQNVHEIHVKGEAGEFMTRARNFPSPENPKTSYLAALSAVRTLRDRTKSLLLGI
ncbi:MAG: aspartate dehydrogenase [Candidatus Hadarchaeota archaeon]